MKITLLITTFNAISQSYYCILKEKNHQVDIVYAISDKQMYDEIKAFNPDIIICPYLKKFVPSNIYSVYDTFILHPGIIGDKGAYSIDNALRNKRETWGVVILKANGDYDDGDIYASVDFNLRTTTKSSIYRNETLNASIEALDILLANLEDKSFIPTKQQNTNMHLQLTQDIRKINWQNDTTQEIIDKINYSDSYPGVLDEIMGIKCYLFGVFKEERLKSEKPKQILAKRDGAICISTIDGSLWISHLKEINSFKLPATYVLKDKLKGIKEDRVPLIFDKSYSTFYELSCDIKDDIAYLHFNFLNGAFRAEQCIRLKYAFEYLKEKVKVVVLMGGADFFSNGINLNILEDSKKSGEDGWSNINAINDLVYSIISANEVITVASVKKNAGAGGVFLALACDYVVASQNTIFNPHYKTLGLSGSEYHSYTLSKRVGDDIARRLLEDCLPTMAQKAKQINMIDEVFDIDSYQNDLENYCQDLISDEDKYDDFLYDKEDYLEENITKINQCKNKEIKIMYDEFWNKDSIFHKLRYDFVYKICPLQTPKRFKFN
ncbi:Hydrogenase assembly protein HoxX [hydrothermal vent metagenome]|uniref:Hydrogenase assembly protein HoxX n=1 Tax=hydrothermal vent metagenome TaxID=652676 RepID=A0A3B1E205_9ZZZZ